MQFINSSNHSVRVDSILSIEWDNQEEGRDYTGYEVKVNLTHGHSLYLSRKDDADLDFLALLEKVIYSD